MRAFGILFAGLAAAAAHAADPPVTPSDSIAEAKKDFAAIKAPAESNPALPGIDVREDSSGGQRLDAVGSLRAGPEPAKKGGGTGNWLVDAMEQKPSHALSAPGKDELIPGEMDLLGDAGGSGAPGGKEAQATDASEKASAKALSESVSNPLDAFMGGWISAHDRELLLPPKRGDAFLGGGQEKSGDAMAAGGVLARRDALSEPKSGANPYLDDLGPAPLPVPDIPAFSPLSIPDLSAGAVLPGGAGAKALDIPKAAFPDFAQPADDDKYFRQMKRF